MRRGLASLIMGLSLLVASASWAGFIMSRTVLDPGRSERLADHLLDNEEVRSTITDRLADATEARIPPEVPVSRETIELAADTALDDPRVEAIVRDGIVQAHQNALNGVDEPITLDASALGVAARDAVVAQQPELDAVLPAAPQLDVELPSAGLAWLGRVKDAVDRYTRLGAVVSLLGITIAFVVARNRPKALRRVAYWAFAASAFWIVAAYAIPAIVGRIAPSSVAIASAAIDVFFGAMIRPALVLAGLGVLLVVVSLAWPLVIRRRSAAMLDRPSGPGWAPDGRAPSPAAGPGHRLDPAVPYAGRSAAAAQAYTPTAYTPSSYEPGGYEAQPSAPPPGPPPPNDPTRTFPQIISNRPASPPAPAVGTDPGGPWAPAGAEPRTPPHQPAPPPDHWGAPDQNPAPAPTAGWDAASQAQVTVDAALPASANWDVAPEPPDPNARWDPVAGRWTTAPRDDRAWDDEPWGEPDDGAGWVEGVGYVDEQPTKRDSASTERSRSDP